MNTLRNKLFLAAVVGSSILGMAGVAGATPTDPLEDAIDTAQDQIIGYAAPIAAALVAIGLAFVGVRLIPKVIRWVSGRLG